MEILFFFLQECWFLAKNLAFQDPPSMKFHNRTDISTYIQWKNHVKQVKSGSFSRFGLLNRGAKSLGRIMTKITVWMLNLVHTVIFELFNLKELTLSNFAFIEIQYENNFSNVMITF